MFCDRTRRPHSLFSGRAASRTPSPTIVPGRRRGSEYAVPLLLDVCCCSAVTTPAVHPLSSRDPPLSPIGSCRGRLQERPTGHRPSISTPLILVVVVAARTWRAQYCGSVVNRAQRAWTADCSSLRGAVAPRPMPTGQRRKPGAPMTRPAGYGSATGGQSSVKPHAVGALSGRRRPRDLPGRTLGFRGPGAGVGGSCRRRRTPARSETARARPPTGGR
jgi:hypothetical protein